MFLPNKKDAYGNCTDSEREIIKQVLDSIYSIKIANSISFVCNDDGKLRLAIVIGVSNYRDNDPYGVLIFSDQELLPESSPLKHYVNNGNGETRYFAHNEELVTWLKNYSEKLHELYNVHHFQWR